MNENINENIKGSQTIAVEDAGHSIFYYEEWEELTDCLCALLGRLKPKDAGCYIVTTMPIEKC